jgi:plasmid stabilization system protein ParE
MRQLTFQPEAIDEANEAFNWYEDRQAGLGVEFYRELTRCLEFILENPLLARVAYRGCRKRKLERFPYLIVYSVTPKSVSVISVFHGSRDPAVWKTRV